MSLYERPNPTDAEGTARKARAELNAWLVGKYSAAVALVNEGKTIDEVKAFLVA